MKIGYALSGGAVRGAAHIGVLAELDKHGIAPCCIAGTSIGAVVGAAYAAGNSPARMRDVFQALVWKSVVRPTLKLKTSLLSRRPLEKLLRDELELTTFEALEIPLAVVACDLLSGERVVLDSGDLVEAVCASSALPGLFPPVERNSRVLVDGGISANLPIDAARALGADYVVGVDLLPMGKVEAVRHPIEIWERSLYLLIAANHAAGGAADCPIVPDIAAFSFSNFKEVDALVAKGEEAARAALERISGELR